MASPIQDPSLYASPSKWLELLEALNRGLSALVHPNWRPEVPLNELPKNEKEARQVIQGLIEDEYHKVAPLVLKNILWFLCEHEWASMDEPVCYHVRAIFSTIRLWVMDAIVESEDGQLSTILPFPNGEIPNVLLWFSTEWWKVNGMQRYAWHTSGQKEG